MSKYIKLHVLFLFISLMFISPVFANNINTDELDFLQLEFSPTENPVAYKYFIDYTDMLRSKIDFKKMRPTWIMEYRYKIHSDGTISDLQPMLLNTPYEGTKINKYFEDILLNNPPPPYPKNMEIGDVYIHFSAELDLEDKTIIRPFRNNDGAYYPGNHITIILNHKTFSNVVKGKINDILFKLFG